VEVEVDISESGEEGRKERRRMGRKTEEKNGKWWWRMGCVEKEWREERGSEDNQITESVDEMEMEVKVKNRK